MAWEKTTTGNFTYWTNTDTGAVTMNNPESTMTLADTVTGLPQDQYVDPFADTTATSIQPTYETTQVENPFGYALKEGGVYNYGDAAGLTYDPATMMDLGGLLGYTPDTTTALPDYSGQAVVSGEDYIDWMSKGEQNPYGESVSILPENYAFNFSNQGSSDYGLPTFVYHDELTDEQNKRLAWDSLASLGMSTQDIGSLMNNGFLQKQDGYLRYEISADLGSEFAKAIDVGANIASGGAWGAMKAVGAVLTGDMPIADFAKSMAMNVVTQGISEKLPISQYLQDAGFTANVADSVANSVVKSVAEGSNLQDALESAVLAGATTWGKDNLFTRETPAPVEDKSTQADITEAQNKVIADLESKTGSMIGQDTELVVTSSTDTPDTTTNIPSSSVPEGSVIVSGKGDTLSSVSPAGGMEEVVITSSGLAAGYDKDGNFVTTYKPNTTPTGEITYEFNTGGLTWDDKGVATYTGDTARKLMRNIGNGELEYTGFYVNENGFVTGDKEYWGEAFGSEPYNLKFDSTRASYFDKDAWSVQDYIDPNDPYASFFNTVRDVGLGDIYTGTDKPIANFVEAQEKEVAPTLTKPEKVEEPPTVEDTTSGGGGAESGASQPTDTQPTDAQPSATQSTDTQPKPTDTQPSATQPTATGTTTIGGMLTSGVLPTDTTDTTKTTTTQPQAEQPQPVEPTQSQKQPADFDPREVMNQLKVPEDQRDLQYDVNGDGKVTTADGLVVLKAQSPQYKALIEDYNKAATAKGQLEGELEDTKAALDDAKAEYDNLLDKSSDEAKQLKEDIDALELGIEGVQSDLDAANTTIKEKQDALDAANEEITGLKESVAAEQEKVTTLEGELNVAKEDYAALQEQGKADVANAKAEGEKAVEAAKAEGEQNVKDAVAAGEKAVEDAKAAGEKAVENAVAEGEKAVADAKAQGEADVKAAESKGEAAVKAAQDKADADAKAAKEAADKAVADAKAAGEQAVADAKAKAAEDAKAAQEASDKALADAKAEGQAAVDAAVAAGVAAAKASYAEGYGVGETTGYESGYGTGYGEGEGAGYGSGFGAGMKAGGMFAPREKTQYENPYDYTLRTPVGLFDSKNYLDELLARLRA